MMTTKIKTSKPILFSTPMVRAIMEGRKTQTRRIIKPQPDKIHSRMGLVKILDGTQRICLNYKADDEIYITAVFPKYQPGDILWVRETWHPKRHSMPIGNHFEYKATAEVDGNPTNEKWKPSIFMPKEACRIFLEVTNVRVERLQGITENDAIAEGVLQNEFKEYNCYLCDKNGHQGAANICEDGFFDNAFESFRSLWYSINGKESWIQNPWVWVYDFKQVEKPENFNTQTK